MNLLHRSPLLNSPGAGPSAEDGIPDSPYLRASPSFRCHRAAAVGATVLDRRTGCVNAPLAATSHAEMRTQSLPLASNGMLKCLVPNACRSAAEMICRPVFSPFPQTT